MRQRVGGGWMRWRLLSLLSALQVIILLHHRSAPCIVVGPIPVHSSLALGWKSALRRPHGEKWRRGRGQGPERRPGGDGVPEKRRKSFFIQRMENLAPWLALPRLKLSTHRQTRDKAVLLPDQHFHDGRLDQEASWWPSGQSRARRSAHLVWHRPSRNDHVNRHAGRSLENSSLSFPIDSLIIPVGARHGGRAGVSEMSTCVDLGWLVPALVEKRASTRNVSPRSNARSALWREGGGY